VEAGNERALLADRGSNGADARGQCPRWLNPWTIAFRCTTSGSVLATLTDIHLPAERVAANRLGAAIDVSMGMPGNVLAAQRCPPRHEVLRATLADLEADDTDAQSDARLT
jgi:hypothetical protein